MATPQRRIYEKAKIREEIIRCGRDPVYFIKNYVKIKHPQRGMIPFNTWDFQEKLVKSYLDHRFNVVLKARQLGATELTAAFCLWMELFYRDKNILCVATKAETAKNIIRRVKTAYRYLPKWLQISKVTTDNKMSLEFDNGSVIKAIASSEDAGRSEAVSLLVVDEAAFIKNLDTIWTGLLPTVTAGGRVIMISTPNGVGNIFHKTFEEAVKERNEFAPTKLQWWLHPEHISDLADDIERPGFKTSTWFRNETKNMSDRDRAQEHELDFLSSGDTFVSSTGIRYVESTILSPVFVRGADAGLFVWNTPASKTRQYFVSVDVARGDATDTSAFHVFDTEAMTQAAEYSGKMPINEYAKLVCDTGWEYNRAVLVIENNSYGMAVLEHVKLWEHPEHKGTGYPNVYCSLRGDSEKGECIDTRDAIPDKLILGVVTSPKTRPAMLSKFEEYIRTSAVTFRSRRFYSELETFIWVDGKPQARGNTDDLIMAAAVGIWIREIHLAPNFNAGDMQKVMMQATTVNRVMNNEIHGASKNPTHVPRTALGSFYRPRDNYRMQVGRTFVNLRELLGE